MLRQNLDFLATLFFEAGITHWAVSPGSRNAPIVAGMLRHGGFTLHSFPDERCAAFAALGMAQANQYPCGVICTSGTAVLNLYPAVCEAYYQRVPLIALTADRPEELIDQWDGQTIHQNEIFEKHILASFETPQDLDKKNYAAELEKIIYTATEITLSPVKGPVHINIPLREPIYQGLENAFFATKPEKSFLFLKPHTHKIDKIYLQAEIGRFEKVLFIVGQNPPDYHLSNALKAVYRRFPVLSDIAGNQIPNSIDGWEMGFQTDIADEELQPDLLITMGLSVVSKKLKQFIRNFPPEEHWHISTGGKTGDPFGTLPETKNIEPLDFFEAIGEMEFVGNQNYLNLWAAFGAVGRDNESIWPGANSLQFKELNFVRTILSNCDSSIVLHLGNSMTVRYAGWAGKTTAHIYCNRGTSGIDGTVSTAMGFALANPEQKVICLCGDISFFYDSNAFWCSNKPDNLTVIILNNQGGKIFNFIDGPEKEPTLIPFIQTPHTLTAKHIASHYGIEYSCFSVQVDENILFEKINQNKLQIIEILNV